MSTAYHKIETLFERDKSTFKVQPGVFKNRSYDLLKTWRWTEKIDGTNVRVSYVPADPNVSAEDALINGGAGLVHVGGRTDNAVMPVDLVQNILRDITVEKMRDCFQGSYVVLYGEGYGGKIQSGTGYSETKKFILFDAFIEGKWWMNDEQLRSIGEKLGLDVVPLIGDMSIEQATEMVKLGFATRIPGADPAKQSEGLVGKPLETLYDKKLSRLITKLKTKDF